ncbi:MAG TPA: RNA methyltransferase [Acidimicrobiales bacterium]|nr:RNA methyltransferase [Acidimicrobiales bacterium]
MPASRPRDLVPVGISHPRVEQFRNTKRNRRPHPTGGIALEGLWAIRSALAAGLRLDAAFVCVSLLRGDAAAKLLPELQAAGVPVYEVSERVLRRMVERDGPDGLAAMGRLSSRTLADVHVGASTRVVVADGFELAGNLGTIIRTADGAGASAVILTDRRVRLAHPLVLKASMGTVLSMPVIEADRPEALRWLRSASFTIVAAHPAAGLSYREADYRGPVAVVFGSERYGLAGFWREAADTMVSIPMLGMAESLNVGHAAALLLYEALHRQTDGDGDECSTWA